MNALKEAPVSAAAIPPVSALPALPALTATDVMIPNPISLRLTATLDEAMELFADRNIDAAPVIDECGHPFGVLSRSDLFIHEIENARRVKEAARMGGGETVRPVCNTTNVFDLMTPAVFAVGERASLRRVVGDMIGLRVHRLFVIDDSGVLVGVITPMDVLKRLVD
jgi:predicted transcriptional regulator